MIPIYKPYLSRASLKYAHEALDSTWLSSQGKYLLLAQEKLQELLNISYLILLNNGTSACHLVAKTLNQAHSSQDKKQLIVPNNVYVAAWNAFLFDNNYALIPIDADLKTWNFDLRKLDDAIQLFPNANVLIVHNVGNIINVPELQQQYPNTIFVEDNCEGLFGKYNTQYSGTSSFASSISFYGNKIITSGEGGAFLTNNEEAYLFAKCIQGQGQSDTRFLHKELGYNYRMTNIQAAILCGQLETLPVILQMKIDIFTQYRNAFRDRDDIYIQEEANNTQHSNWMFGVRVLGNSNYAQAEAFFQQREIEIRPMFYSIFEHTYLRTHPSIFGTDCSNANLLQKECFILPSFPELTKEEVEYIIKITNEYAKII